MVCILDKNNELLISHNPIVMDLEHTTEIPFEARNLSRKIK